MQANRWHLIGTSDLYACMTLEWVRGGDTQPLQKCKNPFTMFDMKQTMLLLIVRATCVWRVNIVLTDLIHMNSDSALAISPLFPLTHSHYFLFLFSQKLVHQKWPMTKNYWSKRSLFFTVHTRTESVNTSCIPQEACLNPRGGTNFIVDTRNLCWTPADYEESQTSISSRYTIHRKFV